MMEKFKFWLYLLFFSLFLVACQPPSTFKENSTMNNQQVYVLHFGEQGIQDFIKYSKAAVDHQPAGMSFSSLDFEPPNLGIVKIENGANSLTLNHVFSVLGSQISRSGFQGIQKISINAGLTKEEFVSPEKAHQAYVNLMTKINQAGWKNYFLRDEPRIAKEENIRHLSKGRDIIDPSYIFSFEEWNKIINTIPTKSLGYRLYANGILLDISMRQTAKNEHNEEQYMLRYSFQTIRYFERNMISNSDQMTPTELEQAFKQGEIRNKKSRAFDEKQAIKEGYKIDESYIDPDVWPYVK